MESETLQRPEAPSKSFMTVGPTLHYSHANVHRCWGLAVAVYLLVCLFWSRLLIGEDLSIHLRDTLMPAYWNLGRYALYPLSIFEYPWQIIVLGTLMGLLATIPVLTSQLLSFRYSLPMILAAVLLARLGLFGAAVLISCAAVACRPLRFRSRFISVALCMAPQIVYWAVFGGVQSADPIQWGFSYAPWVYAWLTGLFLSGAALTVGHYNRYKPGLVWSMGAVMLLAVFGLFAQFIGFAELDYQLYVAGNNPDEAEEFYDHSLAPILDEIIRDETSRSFLAGRFYPTEPILLRQKLKEDIQSQMAYGRWPEWIVRKLPDAMQYHQKRYSLLGQYAYFIQKWPQSRRVPVALYYKAMLNEMNPDIRAFADKEILHFYSDYPYYANILIWQELYDTFPASPESIEARWRIAMREAGQGKFEKAAELCDVALTLLAEKISAAEQPQEVHSGLLAAFRPPAKTAMTVGKMRNLAFRIQKLQQLISKTNQGQTPQSAHRLAELVMMNPYQQDYEAKLDTLMMELTPDDPLRDNVQLACAVLVQDMALRVSKISEVMVAYAGTDGGIEAFYELASLKIGVWKNQQIDPAARNAALAEARALLEKITQDYGNTLWAGQAKSMLASLPAASQ